MGYMGLFRAQCVGTWVSGFKLRIYGLGFKHLLRHKVGTIVIRGDGNTEISCAREIPRFRIVVLIQLWNCAFLDVTYSWP